MDLNHLSKINPEIASNTIQINPYADQRQEMVEYFEQTFITEEKLFKLIRDPKAYYLKP